MAEDSTHERLALAKAAFDFGEAQVSALESKAGTYLTVNSLLVASGILAVPMAPTGAMHTPYRLVLLLLIASLLVFVASAFWSLFGVLAIREYLGHPRGKSVLEGFARDDAATLRESLAQYWAHAEERNRPAVQAKSRHLKNAAKRTQLAFWSFIATMTMLTGADLVNGAGEMKSETVLSSESKIENELRDEASPKPSGRPTLPVPKPIEGVPVEKGEPPIKTK